MEMVIQHWALLSIRKWFYSWYCCIAFQLAEKSHNLCCIYYIICPILCRGSRVLRATFLLLGLPFPYLYINIYTPIPIYFHGQGFSNFSAGLTGIFRAEYLLCFPLPFLLVLCDDIFQLRKDHKALSKAVWLWLCRAPSLQKLAFN